MKRVIVFSLFIFGAILMFCYITKRTPPSINVFHSPSDSARKVPITSQGPVIRSKKIFGPGVVQPDQRTEKRLRLVEVEGNPEFYYFPALAKDLNSAGIDKRIQQLQHLRNLRANDPVAQKVLEKENELKSRSKEITDGESLERLIEVMGPPTAAFLRVNVGDHWELRDVSPTSKEFQENPGYLLYSASGKTFYRTTDIHELFVVFIDHDLMISNSTWYIPGTRYQ